MPEVLWKAHPVLVTRAVLVWSKMQRLATCWPSWKALLEVPAAPAWLKVVKVVIWSAVDGVATVVFAAAVCWSGQGVAYCKLKLKAGR